MMEFQRASWGVSQAGYSDASVRVTSDWVQMQGWAAGRVVSEFVGATR